VKTILVTGGAGYIGSHTCLELLAAGYQVVVVDNLCNSSEESLRRVQEITGKPLTFINRDVRDAAALTQIFERDKIDAVIHFAGLKAVAESIEYPQHYHEVNVAGSITLCEVMAQHEVFNLVFSSSATVYGFASDEPITEQDPTQPINPYGENKLAVEQHLHQLCQQDPRWNCISLRYFNPVGAHHSGKIGENPAGIPNNLTPYITQVAIGRLEQLSVWGNDWPTPDGTGVRDYIHVVDLARGHLRAVDVISDDPGELIINLGTGRPYSVLEVVAAFEKAVGKPIPYQIKPRRNGDLAALHADASMASEVLNWRAELDINAMAADAWRWQQQNPNGFD
jgi:UDP-glucose 4-epimerase